MKWQQKHTSLTVIAIGFGLLYFFFKKEWMLVLIGIVFIGFLLGNVGTFIHLTWMMIAKILGYINSRIILSILFFLLLTPLALLRRLLQRNKQSPRLIKSFFTERNHVFTKEDLQSPW